MDQSYIYYNIYYTTTQNLSTIRQLSNQGKTQQAPASVTSRMTFTPLNPNDRLDTPPEILQYGQTCQGKKGLFLFAAYIRKSGRSGFQNKAPPPPKHKSTTVEVNFYEMVRRTPPIIETKRYLQLLQMVRRTPPIIEVPTFMYATATQHNRKWHKISRPYILYRKRRRGGGAAAVTEHARARHHQRRLTSTPTRLFNPLRGLDEVDRVVVVLIDTRGDGENVGVEDDVLGREPNLRRRHGRKEPWPKTRTARARRSTTAVLF